MESKREVKSYVTARRAVETAEQKEHRLSKPRTFEKGVLLVQLLRYSRETTVASLTGPTQHATES